MGYSKNWNASIGCLNLTLGARNVIWTFLFHFSFISSASWLILGGVMSARHQAAIALLRIVNSSSSGHIMYLHCTVIYDQLGLTIGLSLWASWSQARLQGVAMIYGPACEWVTP